MARKWEGDDGGMLGLEVYKKSKGTLMGIFF